MIEREKSIRVTCDEHGLEVSSVEVEGDVLQLVPSTLAKTAGANPRRFQELALELKSAWGFRYVTLVIDEGEDE